MGRPTQGSVVEMDCGAETGEICHTLEEQQPVEGRQLVIGIRAL